jgi:hypothetical protein
LAKADSIFYGALGKTLKLSPFFIFNQNPQKNLTKTHTNPQEKSSAKINITKKKKKKNHESLPH